MSNRDRNQWIAIAILTTAVICLMVLFVLNPTKPQSPVDLQPIFPVTGTVEIPATAESAATHVVYDQAYANAVCAPRPVDTFDPTTGKVDCAKQEIIPTNGTPAQTPEVASTPIVIIPATATSTPISSDEVECYFAGARMTDGHVPGAERNGGSGRCDIDALINSMSMQAFWEEVVNNDTHLPVGLKLTDVAANTYEPGNDFPRAFAINNNGTLSYFVPDTSEGVGLFPFWWTSCVKYNVETNVMTFYKDDSGNAGGFDGTCAGTWKEFDGKPATAFSGETLTYIKAIQDLATKGYTLPSQPYVFDVIWFEAWPPQ